MNKHIEAAKKAVAEANAAGDVVEKLLDEAEARVVPPDEDALAEAWKALSDAAARAVTVGEEAVAQIEAAQKTYREAVAQIEAEEAS